MPQILQWSVLRENCRQPLETLTSFDAVGLVHGFRKLARWCLRREVLELAAKDDTQIEGSRATWRKRPDLPRTHGSCSVVFATEDADGVPLLRPAFVLPFQWVQGEPHSLSLPKKMANFADFVLDSLRDVSEVSANHWGLRLHPVLGELDLRDVTLRYESGWAALAAGVLVAATRGRPNPSVWATAAWSGGVRPVDGLDVKLALAADFGVQKLFVPASAMADSQLARTVVGLPENESVPRTALREYLRLLNVAPGSDDPRADREQWYLTQWEDDLVEQYYRNHLLDEVVQHCREQLPEGEFDSGVSHLVTIASKNPELVAIAVGSLRPSRCLVLFTSDLTKQRDEAVMLVHQIAKQQRWALQPEHKEFAGIPEFLNDVPAVVRAFVGTAKPEQIVFDLTPGLKEMSFALLFDVAQRGQRLFYLRHRWHGKRVQPFSIQPRILVAGGGLSFRTG